MSIVRRAAPLAGQSAAITTESRRWWPPSAASHESRVHKVAAGKSLQPSPYGTMLDLINNALWRTRGSRVKCAT